MGNLVLDIGNFRVKGALFEGDKLVQRWAISCHPFSPEQLKGVLKKQRFEQCLISSVNEEVEKQVRQVFKEENLLYIFLNFADVKVKLEVDEPEQLGHDRIANVYGALFRFPRNDCIVVDIGTAVTFDYIGKTGSYLGGTIYPGMELCAKALADYTSKLPLVEMEKPSTPVGKTTKSQIQSGIYYGLLGAIERTISEVRLTNPSPSSIQVIATGGATYVLESEEQSWKAAFVEDLEELVDFIDPHLTLVGLHEILKEYITKK